MRGRITAFATTLILVGGVLVGACSGNDGATGPAGAAGTPGAAGTAGSAGATGATGATGTAGATGAAGDAGARGPAGEGFVPLESAGVVGFVRDTAGKAVVGATVYLVPSADVPKTPLGLTDIAVERASTADEPLEDPIATKGASYTKAVTDPDGVYRIPTVAAGSYFLTAVPAAADKGHLPGGNHCRMAMASTALVGKRLDVELSTRPSDSAEYVGTSVCLTCHGVTHEKQTLHMLGLRVMGKTGPLQDSRRFPNWNAAINAKFTAAGTNIYVFGYNGNAASPDWKASETDPGSAVSFRMRLYTAAGKYYIELTNVAGAAATKTYEAGISYGGGLYKQRYLAKIGTSWYVLPLQYNFQGIANEQTAPYARWTWQHYNAQNWYDEANKVLKEPALSKSFDNNCAGCHMTGIKLDGDAATGWKAHGVPDERGEMDFDGDGYTEQLNMGCETCHGPGSEHWAWAGQGRAIVSPQLLTPEREVAICSQCHTRALGVGGGATETPFNAAGRMMVAGTSRADFLANHVSKLDDGMWDATKGDGKHAKKHHQQASDFLKSGKYRNSTQLMTCASCHDPHGDTTEPHQLRRVVDTANGGPGLCMGCHDSKIPAGATLAARMKDHYKGKGIADVPMGNIACTSCHMPPTAKSGAGAAGLTTAGGTTFYVGDISSHVFDVPLLASVPTKASDSMALPYTRGCAVSACHSSLP